MDKFVNAGSVAKVVEPHTVFSTIGKLRVQIWWREVNNHVQLSFFIGVFFVEQILNANGFQSIRFKQPAVDTVVEFVKKTAVVLLWRDLND